MYPSHSRDLWQCLEQLNRIGIALSRERDTPKLLETILIAAKRLLNADAGTLYLLDKDERRLRFEVLRNDSLQLYLGGTTGATIPFDPIEVNIYSAQWRYILATGNWSASGHIEGPAKLHFVEDSESIIGNWKIALHEFTHAVFANTGAAILEDEVIF